MVKESISLLTRSLCALTLRPSLLTLFLAIPDILLSFKLIASTLYTFTSVNNILQWYMKFFIWYNYNCPHCSNGNDRMGWGPEGLSTGTSLREAYEWMNEWIVSKWVMTDLEEVFLQTTPLRLTPKVLYGCVSGTPLHTTSLHFTLLQCHRYFRHFTHLELSLPVFCGCFEALGSKTVNVAIETWLML